MSSFKKTIEVSACHFHFTDGKLCQIPVCVWARRTIWRGLNEDKVMMMMMMVVHGWWLWWGEEGGGGCDVCGWVNECSPMLVFKSPSLILLLQNIIEKIIIISSVHHFSPLWNTSGPKSSWRVSSSKRRCTNSKHWVHTVIVSWSRLNLFLGLVVIEWSQGSLLGWLSSKH